MDSENNGDGLVDDFIGNERKRFRCLSCCWLVLLEVVTSSHIQVFFDGVSPRANTDALWRNLQVTIGSQDLKANHAIEQIVEVVSEYEKYPK